MARKITACAFFHKLVLCAGSEREEEVPAPVSDRGKDQGEQTSPDSIWSAVGQHAGWGLTMAASMGFFLWVGWELDGWIGTMPLLTVTGALLGAGAGFYSMYRHLTATQDEPDGDELQETPEPDDD